MKIKGEIIIENKKKSAIVEQLVRHKFEPDPVMKWKELVKKRELERCGEVAPEEDEEVKNLRGWDFNCLYQKMHFSISTSINRLYIFSLKTLKYCTFWLFLSLGFVLWFFESFLKFFEATTIYILKTQYLSIILTLKSAVLSVLSNNPYIPRVR